MNKINSEEELRKMFFHESDAYDVDAHFILLDMDYEYPIWIEFLGYTHLGPSYKVRDKAEMLELKKTFEEL